VAIDEVTITMVIEKSEKKIGIPQSSVTKLDLFRGKKRCTAKGALAGAIVGAALMVGYFSGDNDLSQNSGTGDVIGGFAFFLLPPTAVGALVGSAVRQDRWVRVDRSSAIGDAHRSTVAVTIRL
jgi:hypothetical protein